MTQRRKILHTVGCMSRGGVETWLMHVMRNINRDQFEIHYFVNSEKGGAYDNEIVRLGGHIHYGGHPHNPPRYAREFADVIRNHGPFAALHSHVYWYSGLISWLGYKANIPIRIAHSHTATGAALWKLHRSSYQLLMRSLIMRYATHRIGASQQAAEALFGHRPRSPFTVLYNGLDFTPFLGRQGIDQGKQRLNIPTERKVIGHVGRFVPVKNHAFLVDLLARLVTGGTDAHLLLVGDGPLLPAIEEMVKSRGLSNRCTFAGSQPDVVPFFAAMDVFVLPSLWEGFPLVTLESQAAGVPVLTSTGVPEEVAAIPRLVERIPLTAGENQWASAVSRKLNGISRREGDEPFLLNNSRFGLPICLETLSSIYLGNHN